MKLGKGTSLECSRFRLNWGNDERQQFKLGFSTSDQNCEVQLAELREYV
jgi:hypothetical protein